jgi:hypothetical protein
MLSQAVWMARDAEGLLGLFNFLPFGIGSTPGVRREVFHTVSGFGGGIRVGRWLHESGYLGGNIVGSLRWRTICLYSLAGGPIPAGGEKD